MNILATLRALLLSLGCALLIIVGLGGGIAVGWHAPAAPYLAAECRGFAALATTGASHEGCDQPAQTAEVRPAADNQTAPAGIPVAFRRTTDVVMLPEA